MIWKLVTGLPNLNSELLKIYYIDFHSFFAFTLCVEPPALFPRQHNQHNEYTVLVLYGSHHIFGGSQASKSNVKDNLI